MKIVTIIGARPQFVKAAAVSRKLRECAEEILVHTGQHYDTNMSEIFFEELDIPKPNYNLGVGSGSHAVQTADILVKTEEVLMKEKPDYCMVYGDTNSTIAGALAASKLTIPVIHIESGPRSYNLTIPEEQNRILTDHISSLLFCATELSVNNLKKEGLTENVYMVGDVMCDAVLKYKNDIMKAPPSKYYDSIKPLYGGNKPADEWYLATVHRAENTSDIGALTEITAALEEFDRPVLFPVHPRIRKYTDELNRRNKYSNICFCEPLGYLEMIFFANGAKKIVTDSGGLQREAYILKKNTVTILKESLWPETLEGNHSILCRAEKDEIIKALNRTDIAKEFNDNLFGDGRASEKITKIITEWRR